MTYNTNWKSDGSKLTETEQFAANLLARIYQARIESLVRGQIQSQLPTHLHVVFTEATQLPLVTKEIEAAELRGLMKAIQVIIPYCNTLKEGTKEYKIIIEIYEELSKMRTDSKIALAV